MQIKLNKAMDLDKKLKELSPWGHYYKFDEDTITGFYTDIAEPSEIITNPELTYCTKSDSLDKRIFVGFSCNENMYNHSC
jgi:hypothetical protein